MTVLKANYWENYISNMASDEEMTMSYNASMSCVDMGIYILNSSKSLTVFFGFVLGQVPSDPSSIPKEEEEKTNVPITYVPLLISIPIYPKSSVLEIIRHCEQR